jgi:arylsulfatase A-like enzyme/Flp pilus assembly protein TadD
VTKSGKWLVLGLMVALGVGCGRDRQHASILLVTLDTTRADRLGAYGNTRRATPNLDVLATRGVVFERAFAAVPMTLPAHATMLTGRLPTRTGVRWNGDQQLPVGMPVLAEELQKAGYATGAFVSAAVLDHAFGLNRGFQVYDDEVGAGGPFRAERKATETVSRALEWLAKVPAGQPAFLWVHLYEPHDPYEPPAPFAERFADDPYLGEVATADAAVGTLLSDPRWGAGAVVAVIGDHAESLGEHGEATHGVLVHDAVLRVPWLLAAPGVAARRIAGDVSQVDLAPTLAALAGIAPLAGVDGVDLSEELGGGEVGRGRTLYAESLYASHLYGWSALRSVRKAGFKLVAGARVELFDTANDPQETHDLAVSSAAPRPPLERVLADIAKDETTLSTAAPDPALQQKLAALGYLSGGGSAPAGSGGEDPRDRIAVHEQLRAVDRLLRAGDVESAEEGLRVVLQADPENRFALRAVEQQLRSGIAQATDDDTRLRLAVTLGQLLAAGGRGDDARRELALAADLAAESPAALHARAYARVEVGRRDEAAADWAALASRVPSDPAPVLSLTLLALAEGRYADAERWARATLQVVPTSSQAQNALGVALEQQGQVSAAERQYQAAIASDPGNYHAEMNLGMLRAARGEVDGAIAAFERVLALAPRESLALWHLGRLEASRPGREPAARGHLEALLAVAPGGPQAAEARQLLTRLGHGG